MPVSLLPIADHEIAPQGYSLAYARQAARERRARMQFAIVDTGIHSPAEWRRKCRAENETRRRLEAKRREAILLEGVIARAPPPPLIPESPSKRVDRIIADTAAEYSLSVIELMSERHTKREVAARHTAMARVIKATGWSLPKIGRRFNRDHTSVLSAWRRYEAGRVPDCSVFSRRDIPLQSPLIQDHQKTCAIRWTDDMLSELERLRLAGAGYDTLAKLFNVSKSSARHALYRWQSSRAALNANGGADN